MRSMRIDPWKCVARGLFATGLCTWGIGTAFSTEKSAHVVSVGTCWSGFNAVVATMDNGDHLNLGDLSTDLAKSRYAAALTAKMTQDPVFYQVTTTETICSETRGDADWWLVGGSIF